MENINIIKTLRDDIEELKSLNYKYNFSKCFIYNKYSIYLNAFIIDNDSCFNKSFREVQFKTLKSSNDFIDLLNDRLKANLKSFEEIYI